MNKYNFNNKKIIITGAGSGLGRALAKQLIKHGSIVWGLDINENALQETASLINNPNFKPYVLDISNNDSIKLFKEKYMEVETSLDCLINNAGIIQPFIKVAQIDENTIKKIMNINFYGPLNLTKSFINDFINQNSGYIVNVSSMGGFFPFPGQTIYGSSKAALSLLTEGLYAETLNTNIKVSLVIPGAINTNIAKNSNLNMEQNDSGLKPMNVDLAASKIIKGLEKGKLKIYIGIDSKIMKIMYNINYKFAIKFIAKKMQNLVK